MDNEMEKDITIRDVSSTSSEPDSNCSSPRSHLHKYRSMDQKTFDFVENGVEERKVTVGVCAMNKKTHSRPMKEILKRLQRFPLIKFQIFPDEATLDEPVENWPIVDCLISFYSKGFPLDKAITYAHLRQPLVLNDLEMQYQLQDRREVYRILEEEGLEIPNYAIFNRDADGVPECGEEIVESDDTIIVSGKSFTKPFVEKPVNAEDHSIYIYYPSSAGGGCQILFRKIGSRSSVYSSESRIRRAGSYIYEDFMPTDGTDVKVYTVGEEYAHAEARKSPVLDGKVDRDCLGKEIRYPVILSAHEKLIAKKVCTAFKQTVCGFDLLRANGKSLVCDVNGFSFVKTSQKYYDDCSQLLADIILQNLAPQLWIPPELSGNFSPSHASEAVTQDSTATNSATAAQGGGGKPASTMMELRCVVAIIRHGDRTPKQKMKMVVTHDLFIDLWTKYRGHEEGRLKLKKPSQLQEILDITIALLEGGENVGVIYENKNKLHQMKSVLQMYGHFSGINRKVQIKAMNDKRNYDMLTKFKGRNRKSETAVDSSLQLLLILKWGGELTPMGKKQAEELGKAFRCVYPGGQGEYGRMPGFGFLRLHSTYRHDLKIYASDEGRVQVTAAAFAKGLLALEGELAPVLVSLVKSDKYVTGMLDTPGDISGTMQRVKSRLHEHLHSTEDFNTEDEEKLTPTGSTSIKKAMRQVANPHKMCMKILNLVNALTNQIKELCEDPSIDPNSSRLYHEESLNLMRHRWEKLEKDFFGGGEFDISLIPDIYDSVKYDYFHNKSLGLDYLPELYHSSKALADIVIPLEYGITPEEKKTISKQICTRFFNKIQADLKYNVHQLEETVHRLDPSMWYEYTERHGESRDISTPHRHVRTRLYITSESHVHSIVSALRCGNMFKNMTDEQWDRAMTYMNGVSELRYLTQIVFMQYEDPTADPLSEDRFHIELFFSPGVRSPSFNENECMKMKRKQSEYIPIPFSANHTSHEGSKSLDEIKLRQFFNASSSKISPVRMSLQPMARRVASGDIKASQDDLAMINSVDETISIQGADVIETLPSLHPLVCLHSNLTQGDVEKMLDEFIEEVPPLKMKDLHQTQLDSMPSIQHVNL